MTCGKCSITAETMRGFINGLDVAESVKAELRAVTPQGYVGEEIHL